MKPCIVTAHQPTYLPWIGLFHKIAMADVFVLFDGVQYQIRDWNNRNRIRTADGTLWLTVPVFRKNHYDLKLKDVRINNDLPWRRKHWRSIVGAYRNGLFFARYADFFEDVYKRDWVLLSELNEHILLHLLDEFGIKVRYERASDMTLEGVKSDLVMGMCKRLNADLYMFGEQGQDYADVAAFHREGIRVCFQKYEHPTYSQVYPGFISHLSVIDLLMNCGPQSLGILMSGNVSREDAWDQSSKERRWQ